MAERKKKDIDWVLIGMFAVTVIVLVVIVAVVGIGITSYEKNSDDWLQQIHF